MEVDHIDPDHRTETLSPLMLLHLHCHDERHSKLTQTILKSSLPKQQKRMSEVMLPEGDSQEHWHAEMAVFKERLRKVRQEGISLTGDPTLRSRVRSNSHARFWSGGGGSAPLADHTARSVL